MAQRPSRRITSPIGTAAFPSLFETREGLDGKHYYELTLVMEEGTDVSEIKKAIVDVAKENWKEEDVVASLRSGKLRSPLRTDEDGSKFGAGSMFIKLKSKQRPGCVDNNCVEILDPSEIVSGNKVRATVTVFPYETAGQRGVTIWLNNVQKTGEGTPIRKSATSDFSPVENSNPAPAEEVF